MTFQRITATNKLLSLNKRIKVVPGGTWAGKTYVIISILINYASKNPGTKITVVAETVPAVKAGALANFKEIMQQTGRWNPDPRYYNATDRIYTFRNKSTIQFTAFENEEKARQAGKRNILFANEVNTIPRPVVDTLMIRTDGDIWLDYNPTAEFWVDEEYKGNPNVDWLTLTYLDNEALPTTILDMLLERKKKAETDPYWDNWWKVYGLGQIGSLEGVVFNNWDKIPNVPDDARLIGCGLDFGYSNDPTALIKVYKWNDKRIVDEVLYRTEMTNPEIAPYLPSGVTTWADSAEPKSIEEIRRTGKDIRGVTKGADSINYGIQTMQGQKYLVTERSLNIIKELRSYQWAKDKEGKTLNKPVDAFNHAIDAIRYHEMETVGFSKELSFY